MKFIISTLLLLTISLILLGQETGRLPHEMLVHPDSEVTAHDESWAEHKTVVPSRENLTPQEDEGSERSYPFPVVSEQADKAGLTQQWEAKYAGSSRDQLLNYYLDARGLFNEQVKFYADRAFVAGQGYEPGGSNDFPAGAVEVTDHYFDLAVIVDPRNYPDLLNLQRERNWLLSQIEDLKFEETIVSTGTSTVAIGVSQSQPKQD
jgi:hypothetical protein